MSSPFSWWWYNRSKHTPASCRSDSKLDPILCCHETATVDTHLRHNRTLQNTCGQLSVIKQHTHTHVRTLLYLQKLAWHNSAHTSSSHILGLPYGTREKQALSGTVYTYRRGPLESIWEITKQRRPPTVQRLSRKELRFLALPANFSKLHSCLLPRRGNVFQHIELKAQWYAWFEIHTAFFRYASFYKNLNVKHKIRAKMPVS